VSAHVVIAVTPCTGPLAPVCSVAGGVGSGLLNSGVGGVLGALSTWVAAGASWLLSQIGGVLSSTTSIDLGANWFASHYRTMAALAAVVLLPLLLLSIIQAVYRQSAAALLRIVAVQLPLALVLAAVAVELVQLSLSATDALSSTIAAGSGNDVEQVFSTVASTLSTQSAVGPAPAFVVLLGALLVAVGALLLWLELLVRAAAVYVAVLFLPLGLASLVWPAVSHWCRRLVDTLVALVLAKFVIVAVLSLAASALAAGTGTGFSSVLGGGALLLLAAFTPFTLLRLVPAVEAGAVHQLEGARQRVAHAAGSTPRSAANLALRHARESSFATGEPGTGLGSDYEPPGADAGVPASRTGGSGGGGGSGGAGPPPGPDSPDGGGIQMWRGTPPPDFDEPGSTKAPGRPAATILDPTGRGPIPLWGGPIPELDGEQGSASARDSRTPRGFRHDAMGPVLLSSPPDESGVTRGPGGRPDGEQTGGA